MGGIAEGLPAIIRSNLSSRSPSFRRNYARKNFFNSCRNEVAGNILPGAKIRNRNLYAEAEIEEFPPPLLLIQVGENEIRNRQWREGAELVEQRAGFVRGI